MKGQDKSISLQYYKNREELKTEIKKILQIKELGAKSSDIFDMFVDVYENGDELNLDKIQIITPRRIGNFGSMAINKNVVLNGRTEFLPKSKLICEENIYFNSNDRRVLGLANGSIGSIKEAGNVYFDDINDLWRDYHNDVYELIGTVRNDVYNSVNIERKIDFAYAITVHKSQGSDFEFVVLVLSDISLFLSRELLYTAITRPRTKLFIIINDKLKTSLCETLVKIYNNSAVEQRKTLLFGHKKSLFRPIKLTLRSGKEIEVQSKIEYIIANNLDSLGINFEYGIEDFYQQYHIKPDFKIDMNGKTYYWEHLGNINPRYGNRWSWKIEAFEKIGIMDVLITTSETDECINIDEKIRKIIEDINSGQVPRTIGACSQHHYYL